MPYIGKEPADIIATAVDTTTGTFSGAVSAASVDADGGVTVDNITIDGTEIDLSSGDLLVDVEGDIILDANGGDIILKDDGTEFGNIANSSSDLQIVSIVSDKDIILRGNDGGSFINALTLDMSAAGNATFNGSVTATALDVDNLNLNGSSLTATGTFTIDSGGDINLDAAGNDIKLKVDGTQFGTFTKSSDDLHIISAISNGDILLKGDDAGSGVTGLKLDFSEAGRASFNTHVDMSGILIYSAIGNGVEAIQTTASGSHNYFAGFFRNSSGSNVGSILVGTTSTAFQTTSDYRLKENVIYDFDATTRLKQLKPARFNFIADADTTVDGFLAHEVSSIVPEAISGEKDATQEIQNVVLNADGSFLADNISERNWKKGKATVDEDGNKIEPIYAEDTTWVASKTVPDYQSIDQSKIIPLLTKALQEQQATIESLTARITALESK